MWKGTDFCLGLLYNSAYLKDIYAKYLKTNIRGAVLRYIIVDYVPKEFRI